MTKRRTPKQEYNHQYYLANRERLLRRKSSWSKRKKSLYMKQWRKKNYQHVSEYDLRYRKEHSQERSSREIKRHQLKKLLKERRILRMQLTRATNELERLVLDLKLPMPGVF
jgi:SRSO17 transposase